MSIRTVKTEPGTWSSEAVTGGSSKKIIYPHVMFLHHKLIEIWVSGITYFAIMTGTELAEVWARLTGSTSTNSNWFICIHFCEVSSFINIQNCKVKLRNLIDSSQDCITESNLLCEICSQLYRAGHLEPRKCCGFKICPQSYQSVWNKLIKANIF